MIKTLITTKNNALVLNPIRRYVKGNLIVPSAAQTPLVTAAGAAGNPTFGTPVIVQGPDDAASEIFSLMGEHGVADLADVQNRFSVLITDTSWRRRLMNRDCLVNHVFGNNLQPFFVKESTVLEAQQAMQFQFLNNSVAGASNWRFALEGRKFQKVALDFEEVKTWIEENRKRKTFLTPFWLTTDNPLAPAASAEVNAFFTNTSDVFIVLFYLMGSFISAGVAGDVQEGFSVRLFDAKTQRPLQNSPVSFNCLAGNARFPYRLPHPIMLEPVTQLQARVTNLITDQPTEVFLTFHGVAMFTGEGLWKAKDIHTEGVGPLMHDKNPRY